MAGRIIIPGIAPALDANGVIDPGASFQFYENRTTTPQDIYSTAAYADAGGVTGKLNNPLSPDSSGRIPEIWGADGNIYTVEWTPTGESPITYDDIALASTLPAQTSYLPIGYCKIGKPTDGQTIFIFNVPFDLTLPQDLNDGSFPSIFTVATNPTATTSFTLYKNGVSIGSISFSTGGVPTVTFPSAIPLAADDQFSGVSQATADATAANFAFTFMPSVG